MKNTLTTKGKVAEKRIHGAEINNRYYVITKKAQPEQKEFTLYEYIQAPTLQDKSSVKPLFSDTHFGNVCYEMFRRGFGL